MIMTAVGGADYILLPEWALGCYVIEERAEGGIAKSGAILVEGRVLLDKGFYGGEYVEDFNDDGGGGLLFDGG